MKKVTAFRLQPEVRRKLKIMAAQKDMAIGDLLENIVNSYWEQGIWEGRVAGMDFNEIERHK